MSSGTIQQNLKEIVNKSTMTWYQGVVVAICFILNFNDGIDVLVVSFTGSDISTEWGLSKSQLGYIFSAGLAGMTGGCLLLAPLGDKIGRRNIFLIALTLITSGMLLVYLTEAYWQLLIFRVITGLGIGGILPNLATVASEISNEKRRDFNVGIVQAGWPLGAILTGFITVWIVPQFGWRFCYLMAGTVSLSMLIAVYFFMPESIGFLLKSQPKHALQKINKVLARIGQQPISALPSKVVDINQENAFKRLFSNEFKKSTFMLWTAIFFGFLTLYTLMSWVPNIAKESGMPFEMATYVGTALNLGAFIGVFAMGLAITRFGIKKVIVLFLTSGFIIMISYGSFKLSYLAMFILTFFIGFLVQGGFNTFFPTATRVYPEEIRSTGVGLAMGMGRFGAILGPAVFGILTDMGFSVASRFFIFSIPLLIAAFFAYNIPSKNLR
jgi:MFS transporter, AAHS family, 4-hydroxybenzoate transporter